MERALGQLSCWALWRALVLVWAARRLETASTGHDGGGVDTAAGNAGTPFVMRTHAARGPARTLVHAFICRTVVPRTGNRSGGVRETGRAGFLDCAECREPAWNGWL
eukprot:5364331-Prymnesium_polylepis.1